MKREDYKKTAAAVFVTGGLLGAGYAIGKRHERQGSNGRGVFKEYQPSGLSWEECNTKFYAGHIKKLRRRLDEAYQQMQQGQFRYAVFDTCTVMDEALKLLIWQINGEEEIDRNLITNLKICERKQLLGKDLGFIKRLHEVFHICNMNGNDFASEETLNHNKVYFAIMQVKDLLNFVEGTLCL